MNSMIKRINIKELYKSRNFIFISIILFIILTSMSYGGNNKKHTVNIIENGLNMLQFGFDLPPNMAILKKPLYEGSPGIQIEIIKMNTPIEFIKTDIFIWVWKDEIHKNINEIKEERIKTGQYFQVEDSNVKIGNDFKTISYNTPGLIGGCGLEALYDGWLVKISDGANSLDTANTLKLIASTMQFSR